MNTNYIQIPPPLIFSTTLQKFAIRVWGNLQQHMVFNYTMKGSGDSIEINPTDEEVIALNKYWKYFENYLCQGLQVSWAWQYKNNWIISVRYIHNFQQFTNMQARSTYYMLTLNATVDVLNDDKLLDSMTSIMKPSACAIL